MKIMAKKKQKPSTMKADDGWDRTRVLISHRDYQCQHLSRTGIPGIQAVQALVHTVPYPIGVLWYLHRNQYTVDILNIWTFDPVRRLGIASRMALSLQEWYPNLKTIYSPDATSNGDPWMRSLGFEKKEDGWHYQVIR